MVFWRKNVKIRPRGRKILISGQKTRKNRRKVADSEENSGKSPRSGHFWVFHQVLAGIFPFGHFIDISGEIW